MLICTANMPILLNFFEHFMTSFGNWRPEWGLSLTSKFLERKPTNPLRAADFDTTPSFFELSFLKKAESETAEGGSILANSRMFNQKKVKIKNIH